MRLFSHSLVFLLVLAFCFSFTTASSFALTSSYRSAGTVTTDGLPYTNLTNCTETDGLTCDRPNGTLYSNLYLSNFGSYTDFGMPQNATITAVHIRATGKATTGIYVGFFSRSFSCIFPADLWPLYGIVGSVITTQTITTPVTPNGDSHTVSGSCTTVGTLPSTFWRLNYSSGTPWSAAIDNFEIAFDYTVPPPPAKTPVIFIPGIGGSALQVQSDTLWSEADGHSGIYIHPYDAREMVWVNTLEAVKPGDDDYFDVLRMNPDGSSQADIGPTGELLSSYQAAIDFFTAHGYELNKTLFLFPYDWRQDVKATTSMLDEKIATIKQQTGASQVAIVAHSMGGLVARNYIADATRARNVKQLFTLGTPHLGAVQFLKVLNYGDCLQYPLGPFCLTIDPNEVKDVVQNMISGYELAPSQTYFTFYSGADDQHPYPFADQRDMDGNGVIGPLDYAKTKELLTNLGENTELFLPSESFHALDTTLPVTNGVSVTNIVGSGEPTLGQIVEKNLIDFSGIAIPQKDAVMINGDATVPLYSASLSDPDRSLSLLGDAALYYTKQTHGDLVTAGPALNLVLSRLAGETALPDGVATEPYALSGTLLSVHSPVLLHAYDASGKHTGPTADGFETNIPGSSYITLGDAKFIFLPQTGVYHVTFSAEGEGSFDFKIRTFAQNKDIQTVSYTRIPLQEQTKGAAAIDTTSAQPPVLQLDEDGNGVVDQQVAPTTQATGDAATDNTPPHTTVTLAGTPGQAGWFTGTVQVTLSAADDASGVREIMYTTDNGQTSTVYSGPFSVTADGITTLQFRAVDMAGNEEAPQERSIRIDRIPPEVKLAYSSIGELIVTGEDANPTTTVLLPSTNKKNKQAKQYRIEDAAGNSTLLSLTEKAVATGDSVSIETIQYQLAPSLTSPRNIYAITFQGKKEKGTLRKQRFQAQGGATVEISYNKKKDRSTITLKQPKKHEIKEEQPGIVLLQLITDRGKIIYQY